MRSSSNSPGRLRRCSAVGIGDGGPGPEGRLAARARRPGDDSSGHADRRDRRSRHDPPRRRADRSRPAASALRGARRPRRLRRAATEALKDEVLRFIRFGSTAQPEPLPGQHPDPSAGAALVGGTIRDVLGVGGLDPLPARLRDVAARGRVGAMVTTIQVAPDLSAVSAESALYYRGSRGWERGPWRTGSLQVGAVAPVVVGAVARDPQVQAVMGFVESIGGGLVSPEMKQRGLIMGTTAGGAVLLARTALVSSLAGIALELESEGPGRLTRRKP